MGSSLESHVEGVKNLESCTRLLEEPVDNSNDEDFRGFDAGPNLGLRAEPGSLLNNLRGRRVRVMKCHHRSMLGLLICMEMLIYNNLISQLDRELIRHQSEVSELMDSASKWIHRWPQKKEQLKELRQENCDLFKDLRELNKLKLQLTEYLLERLEQLKMAMDDIADLQKILSEKESEIANLQSQSTHDLETYELKVRVWSWVLSGMSARLRDFEKSFVERTITSKSYLRRINSCALK